MNVSCICSCSRGKHSVMVKLADRSLGRREILASDSFLTPVHVRYSRDALDSPLPRRVTVEVFPGVIVISRSYKSLNRELAV